MLLSVYQLGFSFVFQQPTAYYDMPGRDLQASLTTASYVPGKVTCLHIVEI